MSYELIFLISLVVIWVVKSTNLNRLAGKRIDFRKISMVWISLPDGSLVTGKLIVGLPISAFWKNDRLFTEPGVCFMASGWNVWNLIRLTWWLVGGGAVTTGFLAGILRAVTNGAKAAEPWNPFFQWFWRFYMRQFTIKRFWANWEIFNDSGRFESARFSYNGSFVPNLPRLRFIRWIGNSFGDWFFNSLLKNGEFQWEIHYLKKFHLLVVPLSIQAFPAKASADPRRLEKSMQDKIFLSFERFCLRCYRRWDRWKMVTEDEGWTSLWVHRTVWKAQ